MASPSNPPSSSDASVRSEIQDQEYLYALNANVSNFVSVKLSSTERNYHLWEKQMGCLLKAYKLHGIVCEPITPDLNTRFDSLVKGWIFSSISEELHKIVVNLESAKEVWDKLKSIYDPDPNTTIPRKAETKTEDKGAVPTETRTLIKTDVLLRIKDEIKGKVASYRKNIMEDLGGLIESTAKVPMTEEQKITERKKKLAKAIKEGRWVDMVSMINKDKDVITEGVDRDANTILHIVVGMGADDFVCRKMLSKIKDANLPGMKNKNGSTALHIAAIVGNTEAAKLLIKRNRNLLETKDDKGETPLDKAIEKMHLDTVEYLLKETSNTTLDVKKGAHLLVNAISAKKYDFATYLIKRNPKFVVEDDEVLMAIVTHFPSGLGYWETLIYPLIGDICERIVKRARDLFKILVDYIIDAAQDIPDDVIFGTIRLLLHVTLKGPLAMLVWIISMQRLLISMLYFPFCMFYFLFWKVATRKFLAIKHIERKKKEQKEVKEVVKLICDEIDKLESPDHDAHPHYYTRPILEAARQNLYEVVDEILKRCPKAIEFKDESEHDVIQLAVINRSEKVYNLIYTIGERKSVYRTIEDSSKNNMLHLVGILPPLEKLRIRTGPALQLQRELHWRQEIEKLVLPSYITKENKSTQTPYMVFKMGHENLVMEAEKWIKAVAESCSITAALITTIVFAAAITVPGGSNQETGIPVFTKEIAFTIFAVSDAISLFASSTSLLMFLTILTGSFDEQDLVVSWPRRLLFGLCTLMLSTTGMMVAFGATLFLVFCQKRPWMLALICVLSSVPIAAFGIIQIPLIIDLYRSTYGSIFGNRKKKNNSKFKTDDMKLFLGN